MHGGGWKKTPYIQQNEASERGLAYSRIFDNYGQIEVLTCRAPFRHVKQIVPESFQNGKMERWKAKQGSLPAVLKPNIRRMISDFST